jgi:hypothetical protein
VIVRRSRWAWIWASGCSRRAPPSPRWTR